MWMSAASVPNALSVFRIAAAPALVGLAIAGRDQAFLVLFVVSALSDMADGNLARLLKQQSSLGARLDTVGDFFTWIATPIALYYLIPELIRPELPLFVIGSAARIVSAAASFSKYRRVALYHTWSAKTVGALLSVGVVSLVVLDWAWPFRIGAAVLLITAIEELIITGILPTCHANVATPWHARRIVADLNSAR